MRALAFSLSVTRAIARPSFSLSDARGMSGMFAVLSPTPLSWAHAPLTRQDGWARVVDFSGDPVTGKDRDGGRLSGATDPGPSASDQHLGPQGWSQGLPLPSLGSSPPLPHIPNALLLLGTELPAPAVVSVWTASTRIAMEWIQSMRMSVYADGQSAGQIQVRAPVQHVQKHPRPAGKHNPSTSQGRRLKTWTP